MCVTFRAKEKVRYFIIIITMLSHEEEWFLFGAFKPQFQKCLPDLEDWLIGRTFLAFSPCHFSNQVVYDLLLRRVWSSWSCKLTNWGLQLSKKSMIWMFK